MARLARLLLVGAWVVAVFAVLVGGAGHVVGTDRARILLPLAAAAVATVGLGPLLSRIDRLVQHLTQHRRSTPYSALAQTAARVRAGSLQQALPGLAEILAEGTGARRATVWLALEGRLVRAATFPEGGGDDAPDRVENLAVLLARPDTGHVVPVLDGAVLRAALVIDKPGAPVTPADHRLMQDVANGAGSLLRSVQMNGELEERVRQVAELAGELQRSRERLSRARDVERRRLVAELSHTTSDRLATLRAELVRAGEGLARPKQPVTAVQESLDRAQTGLDELLDRFRAIARGVYPAVLRDQGPAGALEELAADLPRAVRLRGDLGGRLDWEVESGIYYVAAAALQHLASRPGPELRVDLEDAGGRLGVRIEDPTPGAAADELRAALAVDVERLAALGGDLDLARRDDRLVLHAWLPDRVEPVVDTIVRAAPRAAPS